ncbi:MAG: hypothetical protein AB1899_18655 [Pseudomonadota bacterium]
MSRFLTLIQEFEDNVQAQYEAIKRGDHKASNKHAKRYIKAFQELRMHGDEGREAFSVLLTSGKDEVRGMAAAFLLRYKKTEALTILEELSRGESLVAFSARETLARLAEGDWQLDPAD